MPVKSMSRFRPNACSLLILSCLVPVAAFSLGLPHSGHKPRQVIQALEQQYRSATLAANSTELDKLLSDDYVGISWNGQVSTKLMQLDRIRDHKLVLTRLDLSDEKVKIIGSVAVVTSLATIEGTSNGADMSGTFRYTRIYQRQPSGSWKITNFEATRIPDVHKLSTSASSAESTGDQVHPFLSR